MAYTNETVSLPAPFRGYSSAMTMTVVSMGRRRSDSASWMMAGGRGFWKCPGGGRFEAMGASEGRGGRFAVLYLGDFGRGRAREFTGRIL